MENLQDDVDVEQLLDGSVREVALVDGDERRPEVLAALNDPLEGEPRVAKTYAESTPVSSFRIDEPGCTDIYTLAQLRGDILGPDEE